MNTKKTIECKTWLRLMFAVVMVMMCGAMQGQPNFVGRWVAEKAMEEGSEKLSVEFTFKDSTNMEMVIITDNSKPEVGRCVSRITVEGEYSVVGPVIFTEIDKNTARLKITDLELNDEMAKNVPESMMPMMKKYLEDQMSQTVAELFTEFNVGRIIYAFYEGRDDKVSFIIGDENKAMSFDLVRQPL